MNAPFEHTITKPDFARWLAAQDRKFEWKDGRIVQMANVTRGHAALVGEIYFALRSRLDRAEWTITTADFGVEGRTFIRFPDVLVEPAGGDPRGLRAERAVVIFEVLSPSSVRTDVIEKRDDYEQLETVRTYVVLSQDEPIGWVWTRDGETNRFPSKPDEISGTDATIDLAALGLSLPLAELYRSQKAP
jgi:Uma2 family endonuclease